MMRFLVQQPLFRSVAQIRNCVVNFPRKNQKIFFSHALLQIAKKPQKPLWDTLSNTLHRPLQTEWRNTFFIFL